MCFMEYSRNHAQLQRAVDVYWYVGAVESFVLKQSNAHSIPLKWMMKIRRKLQWNRNEERVREAMKTKLSWMHNIICWNSTTETESKCAWFLGGRNLEISKIRARLLYGYHRNYLREYAKYVLCKPCNSIVFDKWKSIREWFHLIA